MKQTLRGVNFGGWLILERWMTPSLFEGTNAADEFHFMSTPGAIEKITRHRKEFIQESDFAWCAQQGIDAIRLPVGYWVLQDDAPYIEAKLTLDWAFEMAEKYNLHILLDLHGAPGSQNGKDHSGKEGAAMWLHNQAAQQATITILQELYRRYGSSSSFWGLQVLNEPPFGLLQRRVRRYYRQVARELPVECRLIFHDGFTPRLLSGAMRGRRNVMMDIHLYHMTSWLARVVSPERFIRLVPWLYGRLLHRVSRMQPVVIGEWSVVMRGESVRKMSKHDAEKVMYQFGQAQIAVFEQYAAAWFYWNYKTEAPGIWNFRSCIDDGYLSLPKR